MKHVNMYRHVCTMFSNVRTVLPILVQVVRIPDDWHASAFPDGDAAVIRSYDTALDNH